MNRSLVTKSKFLSLILRHKPEEIGLHLDDSGWAVIEHIIEKARVKGTIITYEEIMEIVEQNNKKRFSINSDKTMIRANQGHSISVDLNLEERIPPDILYHGTALKNIDGIFRDGIVKGKRHHVHLSLDEKTALSVGQRHGKPTVLRINSKMMHEDGLKFFISENSVWLTDYVSSRYII